MSARHDPCRSRLGNQVKQLTWYEKAKKDTLTGMKKDIILAGAGGQGEFSGPLSLYEPKVH
jgi:hypothetical protein